MKKIIFIIAAMLTMSNLVLAQDYMPPQKQFDYEGNTVYLNSELFQQSGFILGWHWGKSEPLIFADLNDENDENKMKEF